MMEHVKLFDWCYSAPERYFIEENDIDNCNTEKILRNKFFNPLAVNDSEDVDAQPININWDEIFSDKKKSKQAKAFVPGGRPAPPYLKLSAFKSFQHYQFLKVICKDFPNVSPALFHPPPKMKDVKAFEAAKEQYLKEQKEYIEWAKSLWKTDHCIRALRPRPDVETVYEAEFKMRAQRMKGCPKNYAMAAQIPLESRTKIDCEAILMENLVTVHTKDLPKLEIPDNITKPLVIIKPCIVPKPCNKHPYPFILPGDDAVSMLPISEIHRELSFYASVHGAKFVASESALRCLVQQQRPWTVPVTVCCTIAPDGEDCVVVVLDSEIATRKEAAPIRTFRAFKHLLQDALLPQSEREKVLHNNKKSTRKKSSSDPETDLIRMSDLGISSDEENNTLFIDADELNLDLELPTFASSGKQEERPMKRKLRSSDKQMVSPNQNDKKNKNSDMDIGLYSCACKDNQFEKPPARSFKRWQIKNRITRSSQDIIVHCAHKVRDESGEILLEPHPEYQLELGGSKQSMDRVRSLALALMLRKNAAVLNVRVDGVTGEVVTFDKISADQLFEQNPTLKTAIPNTLYCTLDQLQGLMPGNYILQHEPAHGTNALLLVSRASGAALRLQFPAAVSDADEHTYVKTPPVLEPVLLPFHKSRKHLPCAFTPYPDQVAKAPKKPPAKQKPPPQAIKLQAEMELTDSRKWPKRKNRKRKRN